MSLPSFQQAREIVLQHARSLRPRQAEPLELSAAFNRVLAEDVAADRDFPPFNRATRDGYALRATDVAAVPARLEVTEEVRAGAEPKQSACALQKDEAVEIMTGAPLPPGADAVVMVEYSEPKGDFVVLQRSVQAGENVVARGSEAKQGDVLLRRGTRLGAAQIAIAAACGRAPVGVFKRPNIAVLSTGDEVVDVVASPGPNQIRNSNAYALAALIEAAGAEPVVLPIAPDEPVQLRKLIEQGLAADMLLISGGVSMGKHDLVEAALAELDAEFFFTGAEIQPGRPVVFGRVSRSESSEKKYFFGLPGNPLSTIVCFEIFARAIVDALCGAELSRLGTAQARLTADVKVKTGLTRFLPARVAGGPGEEQVARVQWQGSGDLAAAAQANCWLIVPPDRELFTAGEMISVLLRG